MSNNEEKPRKGTVIINNPYYEAYLLNHPEMKQQRDKDEVALNMEEVDTIIDILGNYGNTEEFIFNPHVADVIADIMRKLIKIKQM